VASRPYGVEIYSTDRSVDNVGQLLICVNTRKTLGWRTGWGFPPRAGSLPAAMARGWREKKKEGAGAWRRRAGQALPAPGAGANKPMQNRSMASRTDEPLNQAAFSQDGGLLVCLMADGQALQLVEHARRLRRAENMPWQVLYIDTVAARYASAAVRQDLNLALEQAQKGGAELVHVSLNLDSATYILSTIVQQARLFRAAHVLLGNRATGLRYWANFGERLSDFSETLAASLPRETLIKSTAS